MRVLVSIFLHGFLLDALLSLAGEFLPIPALHLVVAAMVFCTGLALCALAAFTPRVPRRLVLPPFLFLVWADICGGFPLAFIAPHGFHTALDCAQLLLAASILLWHRRWRRTPPELDAAAFSWARFASIAVPALLGLPLAVGAAAINATGAYIESSSGGYVKLRPEGLVLEERTLTKDGKSVRLVSMMHIGEKTFYEHIRDSLPTDGAAIVLLEGVTDNNGLLKGRFSYAKIAKMLGLTPQESSRFQQEGKSSAKNSDPASGKKSNVEYRYADVDISIFQPLTLAFINSVGTILSDPTANTILGTMRDPDSPFRQPGADEVVMHDILEKRNEHLVAEIDRALETANTVIVPWGALHLSGIESSLKERGFKETGRVSRPIIHFWQDRTAAPAK